MIKLPITFTGIDEQTPFPELQKLLAAGVELGILVTKYPDFRHRYPSTDWVDRTIRELADYGSIALHICGTDARRDLMNDTFDYILEGVSRIQLNGQVSPGEAEALIERYPDQAFITQYVGDPTELHRADLGPRHSVLVDESGGRGVLAKDWPLLRTTKPVGFAGGLNAKTIPKELPRILKEAKPGWWIDMESGLRDDLDWFSAQKAWETLETIQAVLEKN